MTWGFLRELFLLLRTYKILVAKVLTLRQQTCTVTKDWPEISPGRSQQKSVIPLQRCSTSKYTHTHMLVFPAERKCIGHHYFIPKRLCFHLDSASSLYFFFFLPNTHMQNHLPKAFHPVLSHLLPHQIFFRTHPFIIFFGRLHFNFFLYHAPISWL